MPFTPGTRSLVVLLFCRRPKPLPHTSLRLPFTFPQHTLQFPFPIFRMATTTSKPLGKRLIVSCDGTWQSADTGAGKDPTNAINFCRALTHNAEGDRKEQIVFYQAGVASGADLPIQKALAGTIFRPLILCNLTHRTCRRYGSWLRRKR